MKDVNIEVPEGTDPADKIAEALKAAKSTLDEIEDGDVEGHNAAWSINAGCSCATA